jgi:tetratricopeptide (TPR) repeat protein
MVQNVFAQATAAHGAGDLARAEALYRQVLSIAPQHTDALHLLGRVACDGGNPQAALTLIGEAVRLRPRIAEYQAGLAEAQRAAGQLTEAVETYRRAARLKPESAPIQFGHGMALFAAGQTEPAVQALRRAVARDPTMVAAHGALGAMLLASGDAQGAAVSFGNAHRLAPKDGMTIYNLGCALQALGDWPAAESAFRSAIALLPGHVPAQGNLSRVLQSAGRLEEAAGVLDQALNAAPGDAALWLNLGLVRRELSQFSAAEAAFRQAEALSPSADTAACIGNTLRDQGDLVGSETAFLLALQRDPAHAEAHTGLAVTRMLGGDLAGGWPDFAWRGVATPVRAQVVQACKAPVWRGEKLDGALLIYAEQGAGDFIQMSRFVARAAGLARGVVLRVPPELHRLASTVAGAGMVISTGDPCPACAALCSDLDLPAIFGIALADVPVTVPYLAADAGEIAAWRARLAALPGRKVGLAWAGNPAYFHDRQRSISAAILRDLAGLNDTVFVSLQPRATSPLGLEIVDYTAELPDFAATAALISALDLVISVDSAVAHLAGALGPPVWLLNRFAPDWRWLLGRDDSPWYPTLRQFRQSAPGDWAHVLRQVRAALEDTPY